MSVDNLKEHQFDKHPERINKNGRPKGRKNTKTIIREYLAALDDGGEWASPLVKAMVEMIFAKDEEGGYKNNANQRRQAINDLIDRVEGKPDQHIKQENVSVEFIDPTEKDL